MIKKNDILVTKILQTLNLTSVPFDLSYFILNPSCETLCHRHKDKEIFICLSGTAKIQLDKKQYSDLYEGGMLFVDGFRWHKIMNQKSDALTMISLSWIDLIKESKSEHSYDQLF